MSETHKETQAKIAAMAAISRNYCSRLPGPYDRSNADFVAYVKRVHAGNQKLKAADKAAGMN